MIPLTAREALDPHVARVTATMRPADQEEGGHGARLYAVFAEDDWAFLGLVTEQACVRFPQRIFADLTPKVPPLPVAAETSLKEVGRRIWAEGVEALPVLDERGAYLGVITRPRLIETLFRREQELAAESRRLPERLEGLNQAARTLLGLVGGSSVEGTLLQEGLNALAMLLHVKYGAIAILDGSGGVQQFIFSGLSRGEAEKIGTWPQGKGLLGVVIQENQILRLEDLTQHPRHAGFPPEHPRMKSLLAMPISNQGYVFGRLYLCDKVTEEPFSDEDELLAVSFARSLALPLAHARELGERRRLQEALRESEARWRSLVENAPDIIFTVDREGSILFINRTPAGLTAEQAIGTDAVDYVVPEHREVVRQAIRRVFETGEPTRFEIATRGPHDSTCWYCTRLGPVRRNGEVVAVTLITRDITERKQAEDALETRVIEQQILFRLSQTLLASLDPEAIAQATFEVIGEHFQPDGIGLRVPDASGTHLEMTAAQGWMREHMDHLRVPLQPPEISGAAWAVHTRAPVRGDHTRSDRPFAGPEAARRAGVKACLHAPMLIQQRVVGVLSVTSLTPRTYSDDDVRFLTLVANQAGIALDRARAHQATREAETRHRILFESIPVGLYRSTPEGRILDANPTLVSMLGYPDRETLLAVNAADLYADPEVHARWQEVMEREGVVRNFEAQLRWRDGSIIWVEVNARSVLDAEGRVMSHEGSVQDITERKGAEEALQQTEQTLRALYRASVTIQEPLELRERLDRLLQTAREILDLDRLNILLADPEGRWLQAVASLGGEEPLEVIRVPIGPDGAGLAQAYLTQQPIIWHGRDPVPEHLRLKPPYDRIEAFRSQVFAIVPLVVQDRAIGVLGADRKRSGRPLDLVMLDQLQLFAGQAASAIQNARLFEEVRAGREGLETLSRRLLEIQETERRHIARELHDEIGQLLTGLKLTLEMISRLPAAEINASLGESQELIRDLITKVRDLSLTLRPAMLDDLGLLPALLWHFDRYTTQTRIQVRFEHRGLERRFSPNVETTAYRIVQEALTNVARHAGVSEVKVRLWGDQRILSLQVEDQGGGFDAGVALASGVTSGLVGMRDRVQLLGGHLVVDTAPGAGTRLTAELPVGGPLERRRYDRDDPPGG